MKRFREVVKDIHPPEDKNVLWLDVTDGESPLLKYYYLEEWITLAGGSGPGPSPSKLRNNYYYGASNIKYNTETIDMSKFDFTRSSYTIGALDKIYYYIILTEDQDIVSVITSNNENITSQFNYTGSFVQNGIIYKLFEFFLDTLIPLDVTATINITGNKR